MLRRNQGKPVQEYADSAIRAAMQELPQDNGECGDLDLAQSYLEEVANSNAEQAASAASTLSYLKATKAKLLAGAKPDEDGLLQLPDNAPVMNTA